MTLELKNVGMIKEANVKIDGLTVIAGENDTGKSTVGKALFLLIKWTNCKLDNILDKDKHFANDKGRFYKDGLLKQIFKEEDFIEKILLKYNNEEIIYKKNFYKSDKIEIDKDIVFIESPLVWNFTDFFRDIALIETQYKIELDYPYLMKDLNFKFHIKSATNGVDIKKKVTALMGGEFKKDESDHYYFDKGGKRVELVNTATGIKQFAIFQVLSQNGWLNNDTVLILDEPEVHLHPKWQLEMAKIVVELVKNGVRVVVNSHSPYMIEALKRYSEVEEIEDKTNFYLAEDGYIKKVNDNNSETLEKIFEKLSEPFDTFEEMDMERLLNG